MQVNRIRISKETDKAVQCLVKLASPWFDGNEVEWSNYVWFPKSQIKIEDGAVVDVPEWLIREKNIDAKFYETEEAAQARADRYAETVERARAAGVKGVRKGMRYATILAKAREQGIAFAL